VPLLGRLYFHVRSRTEWLPKRRVTQLRCNQLRVRREHVRMDHVGDGRACSPPGLVVRAARSSPDNFSQDSSGVI